MMKPKWQHAINQFLPFLLFGITIALLVGLLVIFAYIAIWGLMIGTIIWLVAFVKTRFFSGKITRQTAGRIIEHEPKNK